MHIQNSGSQDLLRMISEGRLWRQHDSKSLITEMEPKNQLG